MDTYYDGDENVGAGGSHASETSDGGASRDSSDGGGANNGKGGVY